MRQKWGQCQPREQGSRAKFCHRPHLKIRGTHFIQITHKKTAWENPTVFLLDNDPINDILITQNCVFGIKKSSFGITEIWLLPYPAERLRLSNC
jgi:hypothetical protein